MFLTSTQYSGNLGGVSGADAKCQARADAVSLGGSWTAWISTSDSTAASRVTHSNAGYVLVDETTTVANSWTDLTDGSLDNNIDMFETGGTCPTGAAEQYVWTGTDATGGYAPPICGSWNSTLFVTGQLGDTTSITAYWTKYIGVTGSCNTFRRLYCFED